MTFRWCDIWRRHHLSRGLLSASRPLFRGQRWSHCSVVHSWRMNRALGERESPLSAGQTCFMTLILRNSGCRVTSHASRTQLTPLASGCRGPEFVFGAYLWIENTTLLIFDFWSQTISAARSPLYSGTLGLRGLGLYFGIKQESHRSQQTRVTNRI